MKKIKTNAMRSLETLKIEYKTHCYVGTSATSGVEVAAALNFNQDKVFKTLVTMGKTGSYYVFIVPVAKELDLKKAAKAVGEKQVEMLKQKDLLPLTGYVHGGCSPIGMKKSFVTVIHKTAIDFESIIFSAGKVGYQLETAPELLKKALEYELADIVTAK